MIRWGGRTIIKRDEKRKIDEFQKLIGIRFNDEELLFQALRHSSYVNEISRFKNNTLLSNERLEFLGDSVVGIVIVERLYNQFTKKC